MRGGFLFRPCVLGVFPRIPTNTPFKSTTNYKVSIVFHQITQSSILNDGTKEIFLPSTKHSNRNSLISVSAIITQQCLG